MSIEVRATSVSQSLRTWLERCREAGLLRTVSRPVKLEHEMAAIIQRLDGRSAVLFKNPGGHRVPVVAGICSRREDFAAALGTNLNGILDRFTFCQTNPGTPRLLARENASCQQIVHNDRIDLLKLFPIPTDHEKDAGPYITAGVGIVRDPVSGWHNLSIHRFQVTGPDRLGALFLPRHTWMQFMAAEKAARPLEIAIAVGLDPLLLLASQATTLPGTSEYGIAAAMLGDTPLDVVRGITVDVEVPAHAEVIIEGRILPGVRENEGPFGEFPKYYGVRSPRPVIEITAVTHRQEPIWQHILGGSMEHLVLGEIPKEAHMLAIIRQIVPSVRGVYLTPGGTCRYHAVVSIRKMREGEAKNAALAAFAANMDVKQVTVVDDDVNIYDPHDVEWAVATRVQADRDLFFVPRAMASNLDPSAEGGVGAKLGIDATVPLGSRTGTDEDPGRFERIRIPGAETLKLEDYLDEE